MNRTKVYYQPVKRLFYEAPIECVNIPAELHSFQAFASKEACKSWLKNIGYDSKDFAIIRYEDDDIEGVTIIDEFGNIVEINEGEDEYEDFSQNTKINLQM